MSRDVVELARVTGYSPRYVDQVLRQGRLSRPLLRRMRAAGVPLSALLNDVDGGRTPAIPGVGEGLSPSPALASRHQRGDALEQEIVALTALRSR